MDKYISSRDLSRFNLFLQQKQALSTFYYLENPPPLSQMFSGDDYYAILFKEYPGETVGHWVVLIKHSETLYEYFDCLGVPPPDSLVKLIENSVDDNVVLESTSRKLMHEDNTICGKWVIFRLMCLPNSLEDFLKFFAKIKMKPDDVVEFIINLPVME